MDEQMKAPAIGVVGALTQFQQACPILKKDSEAGTKFKYKYGSLPMILEEIKPHLGAAGLAISQPVQAKDGIQYIDTIIYHAESGTDLRSRMILPDFEFDQMNRIQSQGAIITYIRRYALISILGLVPEEDNDAQGAIKATQQRTQSTQAAKSSLPKKPWLNPQEQGQPNPVWKEAVKYLHDGGKMANILEKYSVGSNNRDLLQEQALSFSDLPFDNQEMEGQDPITDFENGGFQ